MRKLLVAAIAALPALAFGAIANSAHDLTGTTGSGTPIFFGTSNGARTACSFCHAAHHTSSTRGLWIRTAPTAGGWQTTTTTSRGTALPAAGALNFGSQVCMSCHDGSVALNQTQYYAVAGTGEVDATEFIGGAIGGVDAANATLVGSGYYLTGGPAAFPSLEGTHPVSVPYPTGVTGYYSTGSSNCTAVGAAYCVQGAGDVGYAQKIVQTGAAFTVECTSCHDPHVGGIFLRPMPPGSSRCSGCHNK